jgi:hypothetical protein
MTSPSVEPARTVYKESDATRQAEPAGKVTNGIIVMDQPQTADGARDDELTVFKRLAQRLQCGSVELRELVQQQHTEMGQCSRMSPEASLGWRGGE